MPETQVQAESEQLLAYPELCFGQPAPEKWLDLCSSLRTYQAADAFLDRYLLGGLAGAR